MSVHRFRRRPLVAIAAIVAASCGSSPTGPTESARAVASLPLVGEGDTMRYYHEPGDSIEISRQETFNAWALARLGVVPPQKMEYRKYVSREAMGRYTGNGGTNGFAEPELWRIHTIWPWDNHEVVHVLTAMIGRPSDFFNEGIAVSFQADPGRGDFTVRFNGQQVHDACRDYLAGGMLPLPVSRSVTTPAFRGIESVLAYRMAGSFVLYLTERFGLPAVRRFFAEAGGRDETLETIRQRTQAVFGTTLDEVERDWLTMLRSR
jgi:hypothetical protein